MEYLGMFLQTVAGAGRSTGQVAGLDLLLPGLAFLAVALIMGSLLQKYKILGGNAWISVIVSLAITGIFIAFEPLRVMILTVVPWFAVLLAGAFFIMLLLSSICTDSIPKKMLVWLFLIVMIIIFVIAGINVFGGEVAGYLPGPTFGLGTGDSDVLTLIFLDWLYSPPIIGAIGLIVAAIVVAVVLVRFGD